MGLLFFLNKSICILKHLVKTTVFSFDVPYNPNIINIFLIIGNKYFCVRF